MLLTAVHFGGFAIQFWDADLRSSHRVCRRDVELKLEFVLQKLVYIPAAARKEGNSRKTKLCYAVLCMLCCACCAVLTKLQHGKPRPLCAADGDKASWCIIQSAGHVPEIDGRAARQGNHVTRVSTTNSAATVTRAHTGTQACTQAAIYVPM